jgi:AGCS family alanine or glycine:cation symporter
VLDTILDCAAQIDSVLWGPWTMIFIALTALFLTIKSGFFQLRRFRFIWACTFGKILIRTKSQDRGRMTPFQATSTALASTVGMGNIAGIATALSVGGPGAIFWMWVLSLFGMMTKAAEITLAVHYRDVAQDGTLSGGPMAYIRKGLGWTPLAKIFSIGVLINSVLAASLLQSHTVGRAFLTSYNISPYITTSAMVLITAVVIIGGIRRIGRFCERLVPFMSLVYILGGILVFILNFDKIPVVFSTIFRYAFAPAPAVGGFAGATMAATFRLAMARGMLSNEAGLGTAPMAHATADTSHPFRQGLWGAFEVFVDTMVICTITAFAVLSTGVLADGESGIELVMAAFSSLLSPGVSGLFISLAILTFCLSTQIGFFIYFRTAVLDVFGPKAVRPLIGLYLLPAILFAGVGDVDRLWIFANISVGVCALPNLVAVLALNGVFFVLMKDYLSGENTFNCARVDRTGVYVRTGK